MEDNRHSIRQKKKKKKKSNVMINMQKGPKKCNIRHKMRASSAVQHVLRMDLINSVMNLVVPPASWVMLAVAWPALTFINACEWAYNTFFPEDMEDKVVIITGAASAIGENFYKYEDYYIN
ncbi:hypothetical protein HYC85_024336 [Camellia sinensis]|uniref:Uncharacterized protein n=1 Tax=Camellia sinensis TaxID=4442 RepID=A0A7J7G7T4_CAMSI|nr:hypothetical protein HYC85_024336 [Camellia sinensis]